MAEAALIQAGDHIRVRRGGWPYWHHGIVLRTRQPEQAPRIRSLSGKVLYRSTGSPFDVRVLHYVKTKNRALKGRLTVTPFEDFKKDSEVVELVLDKGLGMLPRDEVEHRARSHEGMEKYGLIDGNCEHFSTWCSTGHWESRQIAAYRDGASAAALLIPWPQLSILVRVLIVGGFRALTSARPRVRSCPACRNGHPWRWQADGSDVYLQEFEDRLVSIRTAHTDAAEYLLRPEWAEKKAWQLRNERKRDRP